MKKKPQHITEDELLSAFGLATESPKKSRKDDVLKLNVEPLPNKQAGSINSILESESGASRQLEDMKKSERVRARQEELNRKRKRSQEWKRELELQQKRARALQEQQEREDAIKAVRDVYDTIRNSETSKEDVKVGGMPKFPPVATSGFQTEDVDSTPSSTIIKPWHSASYENKYNSRSIPVYESRPNKPKVTPESFTSQVDKETERNEVQHKKRIAQSWKPYSTSVALLNSRIPEEDDDEEVPSFIANTPRPSLSQEVSEPVEESPSNDLLCEDDNASKVEPPKDAIPSCMDDESDINVDTSVSYEPASKMHSRNNVPAIVKSEKTETDRHGDNSENKSGTIGPLGAICIIASVMIFLIAISFATGLWQFSNL